MLTVEEEHYLCDGVGREIIRLELAEELSRDRVGCD
jgi:hypothetical protein